MKYFILIGLFLLIGVLANAQDSKLIQHLNFSYGKTFTGFQYENDLGQEDENLTFTNGNAYAISLGMRIGKRHLLRPEILYSEAGAKSEFLNDPISWKLNYLGVGASYLFHVFNLPNFSISPGVIIGYDYLLKGEQNIGEISYDLKETDALKTWDLNAGALISGRFKVTESLSIIAEYRYNLGLNQIEKKDEGERTKNFAHKALIGLSFNISRHEKDTTSTNL
jgi:hypothetical protein